MAGSAAVVEAAIRPDTAADAPRPLTSDPQPVASTSGSHGGTTAAVLPANDVRTGRRYLCFFRHHLLDFRLEEVMAVAEMAGCSRADVQWEVPCGGDDMSPFWYVWLPSDAVARRIAQRSLLIKGLFQVWAEGGDWQELQASFTHNAATAAPFLGPGSTFKVHVTSFGAKLTKAQHAEAMQQLQFVPFGGRAQMRDPDLLLWCIWCNPVHGNGMPGKAPTRLYLARQVALGDNSCLKDYMLSQRAYLGPTSMDTEMAFLMCNQAQVQRGQLVFDPYVGTGSILVAAAHHGAHTMGGDIDIRVIKLGKPGKDGTVCDIYSNYRQYGLPWPAGLVRMDAHRPPFRPGLEEVFDAIIGDPPYGVRAGGRKTVPKDSQVRCPETHIASTEGYSLTECLADLLELAAKLLRIGGRLVYFLPSTPDTYGPDQVPTHPALELLANTEQPLAARYSRRLVTMAKARPYDAATAAVHKKANEGRVMAIDRLHDMVYAADAGPPPVVLNNKKWRGKMV